MADGVLLDQFHDVNQNTFQNDVGLLPIPPLDLDILTDDLSLPENFTADLGFDLDLDFTCDDLYFAENLLSDPDSDSNSASPEPPALDNSSHLSHQPNPKSGSASPDLTTHESNPTITNQSLKVESRSDCEVNRVSEEISAFNSSQESGNSDRVSDVSGSTNCRSSGDNFNQKLNYSSPEWGSCNQEPSHGSGEYNSGVSQAVSLLSPESGHSDRDDLSSVRVLPHRDSNIKDEDAKNISKRKKAQEDLNFEARTNKFSRSSTVLPENNGNFNLGSEEDEKRKARLMRNRESAQLSRQRKKQHVEELEDKVRTMHSTITELNSKISFMMAENACLRQQLAGGSACPPPPTGMYPMVPPPLGYPWMPCAPYVVKPQGSQVPLLPIPRLKPQQPAPASKVSKKSERKKSQGKTKRVASISFLGLLFFMLLFGGLVPIVNLRFGGIGGAVNFIGRSSDPLKGKVLMVNGHINGSDHGRIMGFSVGKFGYRNNEYCKGVGCERLELNMEHQIHGAEFKTGPDGSAPLGNASEPLVASLYVPRNDKLVKIDGNLIIHSVMATEKARAPSADGGRKTSEETPLAIARNYGRHYPIPGVEGNNGRLAQLDRDTSGLHRALGSGSADDFKSSTSDRKLQQWFREDLAGNNLWFCADIWYLDSSCKYESIPLL
ncbi:hypothetical protein Ancab_013929 [Ancistrocladus abbreviatus]